MSKKFRTIFLSKGILLYCLLLLSFIGYQKSANGGTNIVSRYSTLFVSNAEVNTDPYRLEKCFPGTFNCSYDLYAYFQLFKPDPSDSSQQPFSFRKKPRGVLTKSHEIKFFSTHSESFAVPVLTYKNFQPIVFLDVPKFLGFIIYIRPPPFQKDKR